MISKNKEDFQIKEKNLLGFIGNSNKDSNYKKYDEPTYLTFRINFFPNNIGKINSYEDIIGLHNNATKYFSYNDLPEPLFEYENNKEKKIKTNNFYSTYDYLININESGRAELLLEFINLLSFFSI